MRTTSQLLAAWIDLSFCLFMFVCAVKCGGLVAPLKLLHLDQLFGTPIL